jgi:hypothetical protein
MNRASFAKSIGLSISAFLFLCSLTQSCYGYENGAENESFYIFCFGWIGVFMEFAIILDSLIAAVKHSVWNYPGGATFTWLANPLLLFAWITFRKKQKLSLKLSLIALILSLLFAIFKKVIYDNEGNFMNIHVLLPGYYIWVSSIATIFVFNLLVALNNKNNDSSIR